MLVKDLKVKTLASYDKSARLTLETINPEDIDSLARLANYKEIKVTFEEIL